MIESFLHGLLWGGGALLGFCLMLAILLLIIEHSPDEMFRVKLQRRRRHKGKHSSKHRR